MKKHTISTDVPWSPVRLRASVFVRRNDHILCVYDPVYRNGGWILPGGSVEHEETLVEGAVREVLEETGIRVAVERLFLFRELLEQETEYRSTFGASRKTCEMVVTGTYLSGAATADNNPSVKANGIGRVKEAKWLSIKEFQALVVPGAPFLSPLAGVDSTDNITVPLNRIYIPVQDYR